MSKNKKNIYVNSLGEEIDTNKDIIVYYYWKNNKEKWQLGESTLDYLDPSDIIEVAMDNDNTDLSLTPAGALILLGEKILKLEKDGCIY